MPLDPTESPTMRSPFSFSFVLPALLALGLLPVSQVSAQAPRDLVADTWVATDALGRTTPTAAQTRPARKYRFVGIFYCRHDHAQAAVRRQSLAGALRRGRERDADPEAIRTAVKQGRLEGQRLYGKLLIPKAAVETYRGTYELEGEKKKTAGVHGRSIRPHTGWWRSKLPLFLRMSLSRNRK